MLIGNLIPRRFREPESESTVPSRGSTIDRFHREVDRMFERFFNEPIFAGDWSEWSGGWAPSLDVSEGEDTITVRVEVPGVDPDDIDVSLTGDMLVISGQKEEESEEKREGYFHTERRFGSFRRGVPLPASVDPERISAEYDKGVLTVKMNKTEESTAKRIPVSVGRKK